ncbi:NAC domain-containing protein 55-like [Tripterygium wilfordii]|uniref:NAC domain-containing protein 55-like n=1 Tax=Tripterygium wilfordii TaxID=458696 RepID=A0A7J7E2D5_TRIWF|nr:NAC domain-containing protein 55-like [Tripterygium wilfordii]KAF5752693.1 NAC domain-containing protein 55-like [Tripterygium wilfordii]
MLPRGFRFNPTDEELIQILKSKVLGEELIHLHFIVEADVYKHEPQHLQWNPVVTVNKNERYYFCKRESESREVSGRGWWKATSHVKKIYEEEVLVGYKRPLTFHRFRAMNQRNRENAIKTNWIMHEYTLDSNAKEWRLCKIKYKGKPTIQEELENARTNCLLKSSSDFEAGNSSSTENHQLPEAQVALHLVNSSAMPNVDHSSEFGPDFWQEMQLEMIDHHHHHHHLDNKLQPQPSEMDYPLMMSSVGDSEPTHEEQFPPLWSWQD